MKPPYLEMGKFTNGAIDNLTVKKVIVALDDKSATVGAVTSNSIHGRATLAAGATSVVLTNNLVTADSMIIITPRSLDATAKEFTAIAAAGSFTVTVNAAATANFSFDFLVVS